MNRRFWKGNKSLVYNDLRRFSAEGPGFELGSPCGRQFSRLLQYHCASLPTDKDELKKNDEIHRAMVRTAMERQEFGIKPWKISIKGRAGYLPLLKSHFFGSEPFLNNEYYPI